MLKKNGEKVHFNVGTQVSHRSQRVKVFPGFRRFQPNLQKIGPVKINCLKVLSIIFLLLGQRTHRVYVEHTFVFCSSFSSGQQMLKLLLWKLLTPLLLQLQRLKLLMMFQIPIVVHHTLSLISAHVFVMHLQHSFGFLQPLYNTSFYHLS